MSTSSKMLIMNSTTNTGQHQFTSVWHYPHGNDPLFNLWLRKVCIAASSLAQIKSGPRYPPKVSHFERQPHTENSINICESQITTMSMTVKQEPPSWVWSLLTSPQTDYMQLQTWGHGNAMEALRVLCLGVYHLYNQFGYDRIYYGCLCCDNEPMWSKLWFQLLSNTANAWCRNPAPAVCLNLNP